jgi:putative ABC transport system permease protein
MMDIRETLSVAIDALRSNKLRAMLTSLGVIIGSASIVLVVTVALTSRKFVLGQIEATGSNLVWAELVRSAAKPQPLNYELTIDDMNAVKASVPGVVQVAGARELAMAVVAGGVERPVNLIGVTEGYQEIRRLLVLRGRYFDPADMEMRSKVCLITTQLADRIFGLENPVGRTIRMGELMFTVIGVFRERVETFGLSDIEENTVIIPFTLMKYYTGVDVLRLLDAQAAGPELVPLVERQVGQLLKSRHPAEAEYKVQTLTAILVAARNISLALTIVLIVIAFIALLISGVGIMNIMLATVRSRIREIGIRKALGATFREIQLQFLAEAVLISLSGGVVGAVLAMALPLLVAFFTDYRLQVSWLSAVVAVLVSCAVGVAFGTFPAVRAARMDPVESLKYE